MKKTKFFALAFAALTLGACSSDDLVEQKHPSVTPGEKGYVSVAVNLPSQPSSRANDNFDDGTTEEYNVKDATLFVFEGTSEDAALFTGAYDLKLGTSSNVGGNITTTYQLTQKITRPEHENENVYALVTVNDDNIVKAGSSDSEGWQINNTGITAGTTKVADVKGMIAAVNVAQLANTADGGYFFMTNAPLYTTPGGANDPTGGSVVTLTEIDPNNIFTTEEEAKANPAASVYVERAVAKVSVVAGENLATAAGLATEIAGWALDMTNKETYIVRNVDGANWWGYASTLSPTADRYRFVGSNPVATNLYRTYWGIDPNYDGNGYPLPGEFNNAIGGIPATLKAAGAADYCLENTFNVANQNQNQTTRVIVAADLKVTGQDADSKDFYVINNLKDNILNKAGLDKAVKAAYLQNATVVAALQDPTTGLDDPNTGLGEADLTVTYSSTDEGGYIDVAEVTIIDASASKFKGDAVPEILTATDNDAIIAEINADNSIAYYKGGRSYYPVMVKHFGDDSTPWTAGGETSYPGPNADQNWLGRWGVLRNNWYEISVNSITEIGYPEVPEVYGTPDDPVESWISVEINVLSWAKRTQSADL